MQKKRKEKKIPSAVLPAGLWIYGRIKMLYWRKEKREEKEGNPNGVQEPSCTALYSLVDISIMLCSPYSVCLCTVYRAVPLEDPMKRKRKKRRPMGGT